MLSPFQIVLRLVKPIQVSILCHIEKSFVRERRINQNFDLKGSSLEPDIQILPSPLLEDWLCRKFYVSL